jgi:hypothetical protein
MNALKVPCTIRPASGRPPEAFMSHEKKNDSPIVPIVKATNGMDACVEPGTNHKGPCQTLHTTPRTTLPPHRPNRASSGSRM